MPLKRGSKPAKKKPSPKDCSRPISEREIHLNAWQWVQKTFPDLLIFHVPNGEDRSIAVAMKLKRMGVVPGVADFLCFKGPRKIAIELKDEGGKQSLAQIAFEKRWRNEGGEYYVYSSLASFKLAIEAVMLF